MTEPFVKTIRGGLYYPYYEFTFKKISVTYIGKYLQMTIHFCVNYM